VDNEEIEFEFESVKRPQDVHIKAAKSLIEEFAEEEAGAEVEGEKEKLVKAAKQKYPPSFFRDYSFGTNELT